MSRSYQKKTVSVMEGSMKDDRFRLNNPVNGIDIYVNSYGVFFAQVGDVELHASCVEHIKKKIEDESASQIKLADAVSLPCLAVVRHGDPDNSADTVTYTVEPVTCTGLNRANGFLKFGRAIDGDVMAVVPDGPPALRDMLDEYAGARTIFEAGARRIKAIEVEGMRYGGRIDASDYGRRLEGLQARYAGAAEAVKSGFGGDK